MIRITAILLCLFVLPVLLPAQEKQENDGIKFGTVSSITKLSNSRITLLWDSESRVLGVEQGEGLYAKIRIPNATNSVVAKHPMTGRGGTQIDGASLILSQDGDPVEAIFTISEDSQFVLISKMFSKEMFKNGPAKNLDFPKIELLLTEPTDKLKAFGTAGLRAVDGHKGSYMFLAVAAPETRSGVVAGWITSKKGSGIVFSEKNADGNAVIAPRIEYGKLLPPADSQHPMENVSEIFVLGRFDDCRLGLERYAWQVARAHQIKIKPPVAGYCTWYADKFGGACNEKEIVNLTKAAKEKLGPYGFGFVQIDDGWQDGVSKNGPRKNFTQIKPEGAFAAGMAKTAEMIKAENYLAGIWFMPFSGSSEDPYWNKDWFVKSGVTDELNAEGKSKRQYSQTVNKKGEPYESFWGGTSLDLTNPAVQDFLAGEVERISKQWGFNYFKLDGLWTGTATEQLYVNNEYKPDDLGEAIFHDPSLTPIAAYRKGFDIIRKAAGDETFILGCNVSQNMRTLGASFGCVDAMRIGPDNGAKWNNLKAGPWHGTNRYFLNGRVWWNDPDPVYVRDSMPLEHAQLIASWVAVSGQLFAFSDWLPTLSDERVEILRRTILPHGLRNARPVDLFSDDMPRIWHLTTRRNTPRPTDVPRTERDVVAFFNWDDKKAATIEATPEWIGLPKAEKYVAFDFWGNKMLPVFSDKLTVEVPPASCLVLAVRPVLDHPIVLSTSRHITQGIVDIMEESWDENSGTLSGVSDVVVGEPYELRIYDPAKNELRREVFNPTEKTDPLTWKVPF